MLVAFPLMTRRSCAAPVACFCRGALTATTGLSRPGLDLPAGQNPIVLQAVSGPESLEALLPTTGANKTAIRDADIKGEAHTYHTAGLPKSWDVLRDVCCCCRPCWR